MPLINIFKPGKRLPTKKQKQINTSDNKVKKQNSASDSNKKAPQAATESASGKNKQRLRQKQKALQAAKKTGSIKKPGRPVLGAARSVVPI